MEQIANVTGLDRGLMAELVQSMMSRPTLIRMDAPRDVWLITPRGVRWVEESPRSPVAG